MGSAAGSASGSVNGTASGPAAGTAAGTAAGPAVGRERLERYSLTGPENQAAVDAGLAGGAWFRSAVPRKRMKELMRRSDYPAVRDTLIWIGAILTFGGLGSALWIVWHSWWAIPFFLAYGVLYGSTSDSRWHESGHGTAFKTRWIAEALYEVSSFMIMRDPTTWRWSHTRHHTDTLVVGRDPEIAVMRPASLRWCHRGTVTERPTGGLTLTNRQSVCQLLWRMTEALAGGKVGERAGWPVSRQNG